MIGYKIKLYSNLQWQTSNKFYVIYRVVTLSMTLNSSNPDFQVPLLFAAECFRKK